MILLDTHARCGWSGTTPGSVLNRAVCRLLSREDRVCCSSGRHDPFDRMLLARGKWRTAL